MNVLKNDLSYYNRFRKNVDFIKSYKDAANPASASKYDPNANVEKKSIVTASGEIPKEEFIGTNRLMMIDKLTETHGKDAAKEYIHDLKSHIIYKHDEVFVGPYCVSITMYPFLYDGLTKLGGHSEAPKHLGSFCGSFVNLVFAIAAQFAGAVSTPEFLTYLDYFLRGEFGDDYWRRVDQVSSLNLRRSKIGDTIDDCFQQIAYTLNSPAAARNNQSVFWNVAYFDRPYFDGIFDGFFFPDGSRPNWESVSWLQKRFMRWFNAERLKKPLTFPVETLSLLNDGKTFADEEWGRFMAQMYAEGHSFFTYTSGSVDSLSSCCRLKNEIQDNTFSFTLGAGGVATGSKGVITTNINRVIQDAARNHVDISDAVRAQTLKNHQYLLAFDSILHDLRDGGLLPVYDAGFISLDKQYLTLGINGFLEGAESLGISPTPNNEYFEYGEAVLKPIYDANRAAKTKTVMFNTEFVPAENLGVKNAKWDKADGYFSPRDCYNSYFYKVESEETNILDKVILHGDRLTKYLDGGSALHCNLDEHLSAEQYLALGHAAIKSGCSYFTYNIPNTICNTCGAISKRPTKACSACGSGNVDWLTRIIGYLKRISNFSEARRIEAAKRHYDDGRSQI